MRMSSRLQVLRTSLKIDSLVILELFFNARAKNWHYLKYQKRDLMWLSYSFVSKKMTKASHEDGLSFFALKTIWSTFVSEFVSVSNNSDKLRTVSKNLTPDSAALFLTSLMRTIKDSCVDLSCNVIS